MHSKGKTDVLIDVHIITTGCRIHLLPFHKKQSSGNCLKNTCIKHGMDKSRKAVWERRLYSNRWLVLMRHKETLQIMILKAWRLLDGCVQCMCCTSGLTDLVRGRIKDLIFFKFVCKESKLRFPFPFSSQSV